MAKNLTNDQVLLEQVVKQKHKEFAPDMGYTDFFEYFVAEQILKDFNLDFESLREGITGNGQDGGVDGFFFFVDDELCRESFDISKVRKSATVTIFIIQSKTAKKFEEAALIKLGNFIEKLTDLTIENQEIKDIYNPDLVEIFKRFQELVKGTASKYPKFEFNISYASMGGEVSNGMEAKAKEVIKKAKKLGKDIQADCKILGARELQELARREPLTSFTLNLTDTPLQQQDSEAILCLVSLPEYFKLISDENKKIRRPLFEDNVRDYQGVSVEVNKAIAETLKSSKNEDFWWLNNGITILCKRADAKTRTVTIEAPQIVNGFQTSHEIFNYCSSIDSTSLKEETRSILVRIIVSEDEGSRNRVIKATNSQTGVQPASLRSTDKIHLDIEEYFEKNTSLYYDRKKNKYKNLGKKQTQIIGIPQMAQAVMSMLRNEPDTARARPSTLLKDDERYKKVFNESYPLELYRVCAETLKQVELELHSSKHGFTAKTKTNLKFYVLQAIAILTTGNESVTADNLSEVKKEEILGELQGAIDLVNRCYESEGGDDQAAKGKALKDSVATAAKKYLDANAN